MRDLDPLLDSRSATRRVARRSGPTSRGCALVDAAGVPGPARSSRPGSSWS